MQQAAEPDNRLRREWYRYPAMIQNTFILLQNSQKRSLMFKRHAGKKDKARQTWLLLVRMSVYRHKIIVLYLSERAVQAAGRWERDGYPRGKAGCLSPSRAEGRPRPSQLHSPPRRTSHSARHRLHTGDKEDVALVSMSLLHVSWIFPTNKL